MKGIPQLADVSFWDLEEATLLFEQVEGKTDRTSQNTLRLVEEDNGVEEKFCTLQEVLVRRLKYDISPIFYFNKQCNVIYPYG